VLVMLLALAMVGGTTGLDLAGMECVTKDQPADVTEALHDQVPGSPMRLAGGTFLPAQQDKKSKCMGQCADTRASCEQEAMAEGTPGTQKNWEASTKCQGKYRQCLGTCE
jgi:hypothetical protein